MPRPQTRSRPKGSPRWRPTRWSTLISSMSCSTRQGRCRATIASACAPSGRASGPISESRPEARMYRYDEFDARFVRERVAEFRAQVERRLDGSLTEDEFKPLRLQNGLYLQLHAYMLRIAIPYGTLSARQLRQR